MQHAMDVPGRAWRKPTALALPVLQQRGVKLTPCHWPQLLNCGVADARSDVLAQKLAVAFERLRAGIGLRPIALPSVNEIVECGFRRIDILALGVGGPVAQARSALRGANL